MYYLKILTYTILLTFLLSCGSSNQVKQTSNNNNTDNNFYNMLSSLQKGKASEKKVSKFNALVNQLIDAHNLKYKKYSDLDQLDAKQKFIDANSTFIEKIEKSKTFLNQSVLDKFNLLSTRQNQNKENFHNTLFEKGEQLYVDFTSSKNKAKSKQACLLFEKAKKYGSSNSKIDDLIASSLKNAFTIYAVTVRGDYPKKHNALIQNSFSTLEIETGRFKRIIFNPESLSETDCELQINLTEFIINQQDKIETEQFRKQIEDGIIVIKNPDGTEKTEPNLVMATANIVKTISTKYASTEVIVKSNSNSNSCNFNTINFLEEVKQESLAIDYDGERKVIPREYLTVRPIKFKSDEEMIQLLSNKILKKILGKI